MRQLAAARTERALRSLNSDVQVTARSCPLLVPLIEEGWLEHPITDQILMQYLDPLLQEGIDTLVLGCTHYPLLRPAMERLLGNRITLVDSAQNCANAVRELLLSENLGAASDKSGFAPSCVDGSARQFLTRRARGLTTGCGRGAVA